MKRAFIFPGQGAQQIGMGQDLYQALAAGRRVFDAAEAASGLPLKRLSFEGPEDELARTDICQPAIFTVSAAALEAVRDLLNPEQLAGIEPCCLAGLSLGEYTALWAAGAMDLETTVKLLTLRGQAMQAAATAQPSSMVVLLGADEAIAEKLCDAAAGDGVLVPANFNAPGQIVVSGSTDACHRALALAAECGASGATELKVAGAFHSPLMAPAAEKLADALAAAEIRPPRLPVLSNVTGKPHDSDPESIRRRLLEQLTCGVRWQQGCEWMLGEGVEEFVEIGPGRVLAGLMRRIDRKARVVSLNSLDAVEKFTGVSRPQ